MSFASVCILCLLLGAASAVAASRAARRVSSLLLPLPASSWAHPAGCLLPQPDPSLLLAATAAAAAPGPAASAGPTGPCRDCGKANCRRARQQRSRLQSHPWEQLQLPAQLDAALDRFLAKALQDFVYYWYEWLTSDGDFINSLKWHIRYMVAIVLRRLRGLDALQLTSELVLPLLRDHLAACAAAHASLPTRLRSARLLDSPEALLAVERIVLCTKRSHPATVSPAAMTRYFRAAATAILPHLVAPEIDHCGLVADLLREALVTYALRPAVKALADPDLFNDLIALPPDPTFDPTPCSAPVNLLAAFMARRTEGQHPHTYNTRSALRRRLPDILAQQGLLAALCKYLEQAGGIELVNFLLASENFVREITNAKAEAMSKAASAPASSATASTTGTSAPASSGSHQTAAGSPSNNSAVANTKANNSTGTAAAGIGAAASQRTSTGGSSVDEAKWWRDAGKVMELASAVYTSPVNHGRITQSTIDGLQQQLKRQQGFPSSGMFAEVHGAVYSLLEADFLPAFLHSDQFFRAVLGDRPASNTIQPIVKSSTGRRSPKPTRKKMPAISAEELEQMKLPPPPSATPDALGGSAAGGGHGSAALASATASGTSGSGAAAAPATTTAAAAAAAEKDKEEKKRRFTLRRNRKDSGEEPETATEGVGSSTAIAARERAGSSLTPADIKRTAMRDRVNTTAGLSPNQSTGPSPLGSPNLSATGPGRGLGGAAVSANTAATTAASQLGARSTSSSKLLAEKSGGSHSGPLPAPAKPTSAINLDQHQQPGSLGSSAPIPVTAGTASGARASSDPGQPGSGPGTPNGLLPSSPLLAVSRGSSTSSVSGAGTTSASGTGLASTSGGSTNSASGSAAVAGPSNKGLASMESSYHESNDEDEADTESNTVGEESGTSLDVPDDALEGLTVRMKEPVLRTEPRPHYVYPIEVIFDPKVDKAKEKEAAPTSAGSAGSAGSSSNKEPSGTAANGTAGSAGSVPSAATAGKPKQAPQAQNFMLKQTPILYFNPELGNTWEVCHRYSEFNLLDRALKSYYPDNLSLPGKKAFRNKDLELVEHRRKSLGVYLKALLDNRLMHTDRRCRQLIYWFLHDTDKFKVLTGRGFGLLSKFKRSNETAGTSSVTDSSMQSFINSFAVTQHDVEEMTEEAFRQYKPSTPLPRVAFECDDRQAFPTPEEEKKKPVPLPGFTDRQLRADRGGDRVDDLLRILWSVLGKSDGKFHPGLAAILGVGRTVFRKTIDEFLDRVLRFQLSCALSEPMMLLHLNRLYDMTFGPAIEPRTDEQKKQSLEAARSFLLELIPDAVDKLSQKSLSRNMETSLAFLQSSRLNEQLVLCLLDELLLKLFPELTRADLHA